MMVSEGMHLKADEGLHINALNLFAIYYDTMTHRVTIVFYTGDHSTCAQPDDDQSVVA